jgi:hypothetical protein
MYAFDKIGSPDWTRTSDLMINSYQLNFNLLINFNFLAGRPLQNAGQSTTKHN